MAHGVSPAVILKHLGGLHFPATRQQIVDHAKKNQEGGDTDRVVSVLNQIDDKEYQSPTEILKEIGEVE